MPQLLILMSMGWEIQLSIKTKIISNWTKNLQPLPLAFGFFHPIPIFLGSNANIKEVKMLMSNFVQYSLLQWFLKCGSKICHGGRIFYSLVLNFILQTSVDWNSKPQHFQHYILFKKKLLYWCILDNISDDIDTSVIAKHLLIILANQYISRVLV